MAGAAVEKTSPMKERVMAESYNFLRAPPQLMQAVLDNPYEG
jgi:hypothetical protein